MTFADLQEAVARLSQDPRIHPNTKVEVEYETEVYDALHSSNEPAFTTELGQSPLLSIAVIDHKIILASTRAEPAIAR